MLGDKLVLYDIATGKYFAGWTWGHKTVGGVQLPPEWCDSATRAAKLGRISAAERIKAELGGDIRVMSETAARRQDMINAYREANHAR